MILLNNKYYGVSTYLHIERIHIGIDMHTNKSLEINMTTGEYKEKDNFFIELNLLFFSIMIFIYM